MLHGNAPDIRLVRENLAKFFNAAFFLLLSHLKVKNVIQAGKMYVGLWICKDLRCPVGGRP
jgi:hypothetical protein